MHPVFLKDRGMLKQYRISLIIEVSLLVAIWSFELINLKASFAILIKIIQKDQSNHYIKNYQYYNRFSHICIGNDLYIINIYK